uniref:G-protein coupled receptors family 1 profile domain-containing protein n=1 Tax=Timema genevievae TaxID=629358 RepID=A0A7R9K094_TIMGE|nr:unnamed protein product [Timema genevievae]
MDESLRLENDVPSSTISTFRFIVEEEIDILFEDITTYSSGQPQVENISSIVDEPSSGLGPVRDPYVIVIPITILYAVVFFTGVVGNAVTCIVIARNKHMRTATNYYLFSLAVSDLLLLVSGLPQEMYSIWSRYPYVFGEVFCVLRGLAAETSTNASVLTITAFTVERYVAICHPFLSHTMSKLSRAVKLILAIWVVALAFAIPQAIQFGLLIGDTPDYVICTVKQVIMKHSFEVATFLFFVAPMTLITVLYALIGLRLRRSNMMKKSSGSFSKKSSTSTNPCPGGPQEGSHTEVVGKTRTSGRNHNNHSSRRVLKMLVIPITILYAVVFFTGVVGNAVTCIVIARNKHMRTATNYYLFSLAVSDLLLLVSGLPQEMYSIWSRYPYVFGEVFCVLRGLAAETSTNASVLTITAFTVERYVAICHPFLSHTMSKLSRAVKLILAIWVVALAFAIPQAIQFGLLIGDTPDYVICTVKQVIMKHSFEVATFLFFVAPMTLITVLYALIGLRLRRSNMMKKSSGSFSKKSSTSTNPCPGGLQEGSHVELTSTKSVGGRHSNSQSSRRVLKMLDNAGMLMKDIQEWLISTCEEN